MESWHQPLAAIKPYIFKIYTPRGSGTGFQIKYSNVTNYCGIATAFHVIAHEYEWEEPIRVEHFNSKKGLMIKKYIQKDHIIIPYPKEDLAFLFFPAGQIPVEKNNLNLIEETKILKQGVEIGWCGFPSVAPDHLCFFAGNISCVIENEETYLVDGVAINGVSGGPVFYKEVADRNPKVCGVVTAYRPNYITGASMPGLSVVKTVKPYSSTLKSIDNIDEARKKADIQKQEAQKDIDEAKKKNQNPQEQIK